MTPERLREIADGIERRTFFKAADELRALAEAMAESERLYPAFVKARRTLILGHDWTAPIEDYVDALERLTR